MRMLVPRMLSRLPLFLCAALILAMFRLVTPGGWSRLGEGAAVFAIGLQAPREGAMYVEEQLSVNAETVVSEAKTPSVPSVYAGELYDVVETVIPPKGDGGGTVSEEQLAGGNEAVGAVSIKNSSGRTFDYAALLADPVTFENTDGPQVLIVHTHATECYMSYYAGYYNADDVTRSVENTENVVAVGEAIAEQLRAQGIGVLHDSTQHDHPEYTGAYDRSETTIQQYLQEYPSISVVLDIHRDAILREDMTKVKPTVTVNGQKASQMMIVVGATNSEETPNPYVEENLRFGLQLHERLETAHSGIMRPLYLLEAGYNQGLHADTLLIEVGTDANVLSESLYSARLLGQALAEMLKS